jgi:hypothetical protein
LRHHETRDDRFTPEDRVVVAVLLTVGLCEFLLYARGPFLEDDVFFADAALSLLRGGVYGIGGRPETNQPPGLAMLLASVCMNLGCDRSTFLRVMIVSATLGLIAAYAFLRREIPRRAAAAICVLLALSMYWFGLVTNWINPDIPFLLTTMLALLALRRLESTRRPLSILGWGAASAAFTGASILLRSAGIALVAAMAVRGAVVLAHDRRRGFALLRSFAPVLVVGLAVQGAWMHRHPAPLDWPEVPGYPGSYLSQVRMVSGNQPELGVVTAKQIPERIARKLFERAKMLVEFLGGQPIRDLWSSSVIWAVLLLLLSGWGYSVWRGGGGALHDWYFAAHELIYLLWPWDTEPRFLFPIAPLSCLYLWRGMEAVVSLATRRPRALGLSWSVASIAGLVASTRTSFRGMDGGVAHGVASVALWIVSGGVAGWMAWTGRTPLGPDSRWRAALGGWRTEGRSTPRLALAIGYACLLLVHLTSDVHVARRNLHPSPEAPGDVEGALWVQSHAERDAVVMARHVPIVQHVSQRKVVWFPPLSEPVTLMEGIRRLGVDYVILGDSGVDELYYRPGDYDCFAPVLRAFPQSFSLAFRDTRTAVYAVRTPRPAETGIPEPHARSPSR